MPSQRDLLTDIALDDLAAAFGWERRAILRLALRRVWRDAARTFAAHMCEFDGAVGQHDLATAARRFLETRYVRGLAVAGRARMPAAGPVLFVANHPGL